MDLTTWLDAEKGRSAALAAHFNVTPAAVSQWKRNGVPLGNMKAVRDFTGGAVSLDEMVPEPATTGAAPAAPALAAHPTAQSTIDPYVLSATRRDGPSAEREGR
jgi:DNA-binding transcriptional regulator YdaS (Cro superfamily)